MEMPRALHQKYYANPLLRTNGAAVSGSEQDHLAYVAV